MLHDLAPLLLPVAYVLVGALLTLLSTIRTRRPYPSCARCEYDLSWVVGAVSRCPECGTTLRGGRFRRANQRTQAWDSVHAAGIAALSLGAVVLSVAALVQFL